MLATQVRICSTLEQPAFLRRQFGTVRFVYSQGLRIMSHRYRRHVIAQWPLGINGLRNKSMDLL